MQSYRLMSWLYGPFRVKEFRLFLFAILSGYVVYPTFTLALLKWLVFGEVVLLLALGHCVALTFLIGWLIDLSETEIMAHVIHMSYHWLRTLVITRIQRFPHRHHLA
ncbi:unnamed protein product [Penicillium camemberti]|uniref:Str. FM013 n=1 Tax=Penicillium camemberti (strain FM 013) TaxID=1429867 RepID=A0A0G4PV07_PENC3|nr:unnamed protein product [Penicillium camemberti]